jgi:hypothetical protein
MSDQDQTPAPVYFALTKETLQEVLQYLLNTNAGVNLYQKLANSPQVVQAPAAAPESAPTP